MAWLIDPAPAADLVAVATTVLAGATVALVIAAVWAGVKAARGVREQIVEQRAIEKRRRVYEYQATFSSRDFTETTIAVVPVLDSFPADPAEGDAAWKALTPEVRAKVMTVLNFYELVATEYNADGLDREKASIGIAYDAVVMWQRGDSLLTFLRKRDDAYFAQWARLYRDHREAIFEMEAASR